jgi:integrase
MACSMTVFKWAEDYLDFSKESFCADVYKEKRAVMARFIRFVGADTPVESLETPKVMAYLRHEVSSRSGYASNKDRKNLSAAWEWGRKYLEGFPREKLNVFRMSERAREIRSPRYVPPEDDFWKVFGTTSGQDRVMLLCFLHLAARRKEIFELKWADVDFTRNQIRIWTNKRSHGDRESDWIPMTQELRTELMRWWKDRPIKTEYVFVCDDPKDVCKEYYGKPFTNRQHFMKRMCHRAGVKHFGFHGIRHLTASILYHRGIDLAVIQAILRHQSPTTTNRYLRTLGVEKARDALEIGLQRESKIIEFPKNETALK